MNYWEILRTYIKLYRVKKISRKFFIVLWRRGSEKFRRGFGKNEGD
jgi:hypothetical protein